MHTVALHLLSHFQTSAGCFRLLAYKHIVNIKCMVLTFSYSFQSEGAEFPCGTRLFVSSESEIAVG